MLAPPAPVEFHRLLVAQAATAEDVERRTNRELNFPLPQLRHGLQVGETLCSAGIGGRNGNPFPEPLHQLGINAPAEAFHVHRVDEELVAVPGQFRQGVRAYRQFGEFLPAVRDHEVILRAAPAA